MPYCMMPYCIYTDSNVSEEAGNFDHIIPLSLGGADRFTVWSSESYNSDIGSKVDGQIANDPLIMLARRNADARGHTNKPPTPIWKKSKLGKKPLQISLGKEKIEAWDPRARRMLDESEWATQTLKAPFVSIALHHLNLQRGSHWLVATSFTANFFAVVSIAMNSAP